MPEMFQANLRFLPRKDPNYRNIVEYVIVSGRRITCWSINHVNRHANNQIVKEPSSSKLEPVPHP